MVVAVVLLGFVVGLVPVVVFRLMGGARRRSPRRRRPEPRMFEPVLDEAPAPAPVVEPLAVETLPIDPSPEAVSERHRDLYDEEYARQVDRVATLRRTIRTATGGRGADA